MKFVGVFDWFCGSECVRCIVLLGIVFGGCGVVGFFFYYVGVGLVVLGI